MTICVIYDTNGGASKEGLTKGMLGAKEDGLVAFRGLKVGAFITAIFLLISVWMISVPAQADVTGTFALMFDMIPQTNVVEITPYLFDIRGRLTTNVTVSGLTASLDTIFGISGVEHAITMVNTTLGALTFNSTTVFAVPFGTIGIGSFTFINPVGPLLFVTQRTRMEMNIAGITIRNLAIYEDLEFRHPFSTLPLGPMGEPQLPSYTAQSQVFGFGDIISLSGQTPSGISLGFSAGFNADPSMSVSTKQAGFSGGVMEPGASLNFLSESITISNLQTAFFTHSITALFRYDSPVRFFFTTQATLSNLGLLTFSFASPSGAAFPIQLTSASFTSQAFPFTLVASFDSTLSLTSLSANSTIILDTFASLNLSFVVTPGTGLQTFGASLSLTPAPGLSVTSRITLGPTIPLTFNSTLNAQLTSLLSLTANATFSENPSTTMMNVTLTQRF